MNHSLETQLKTKAHPPAVESDNKRSVYCGTTPPRERMSVRRGIKTKITESRIVVAQRARFR